MSEKYDITMDTPMHLVHVIKTDPSLYKIRFIPNFIDIVWNLYKATPAQFRNLTIALDQEREAQNKEASST